jgi:hypothetical protein
MHSTESGLNGAGRRAAFPIVHCSLLIVNSFIPPDTYTKFANPYDRLSVAKFQMVYSVDFFVFPPGV